MYLTNEDDLLRAMETAYLHCRPEGAALLVPDYVLETFRPMTQHGGHDGEGRGIRYLEWTYDPDPTDTTAVANFVYLLREANGSVRVEHEQHLFGLFRRAVWLRLLTDTGFVVRIENDKWEREIFVCTKA
jgi:hypothetical protein